MTARKIEKRPWTEEELQKIRIGCRKGLSARQIAQRINRRVASVKNKARELGLVPPKKSESR
jgi:DNA-binding NarL/FixJ family response regulator